MDGGLYIDEWVQNTMPVEDYLRPPFCFHDNNENEPSTDPAFFSETRGCHRARYEKFSAMKKLATYPAMI